MKSRFVRVFVLALCLWGLRVRAGDPFAEGVRTTDPLPPEEQQKKFHLPADFEVQLVACEPDINKPMNMAFDATGRLWVTTSREYPFPAPTNRIGRDRVMIFEDFGPDGRARKVTQFADGLNIPIGIYPFRSPSQSTIGNRQPAITWKAVVWSIPNIWLMEDTDGDGKSDKREVLYGPFDHTRDTHGNQASFRRGFDGWLYATHGFNNDSHVKGRDGHQVDLNSGNTYRMRLDGSHIEHHTWGQVNPFGLAWDPLGNLYSSDCHSAPVYQLLAGGFYPSFGKPHDGLGFAPVLMEHSHGSTAIDGMLYYADDLWPEEFKDNVFVGNVMTSRLNRDKLAFNGSTPNAIEQPDFLTTDDPWFRPVDNQLGPDGALYIADFYNRIIGHYEVPLTHPGRDRERGRIWRVVYKGSARGSRAAVGGPPTDATKDDAAGRRVDQASGLRSPKLPDDLDGLIAELGSPNLTRRMLAMNEIQDRLGASAVKRLQQVVQKLRGSSAKAAYVHLHALWLLVRLDALDDTSLSYAASRANSLLRSHVMRILTERGLQSASRSAAKSSRSGLEPAIRKLAVNALNDPDALVQRCAGELLGVWPTFNLRPLLDLRARVPAADTHLLYVVRKAIRDHLNDDNVFRDVLSKQWSESDLAAFADVAVAVKSPLAGTFLLRQLERAKPDRETAGNWLRHAARYAPVEEMDKLAAFARKQIPEGFSDELYAELDRQFALFKSVDEGLQQRGGTMPAAIRDWGAELVKSYFHSLDTHHVWGYQPYEPAPTANPWDFEKRHCSDGQTRTFTSSFPHGEQLTGVLRSPVFTVQDRISFWLCGHDGFPDKPAQKKNRVRLRLADSGEVVAGTFAPRNDVAQRINWNLSPHKGKKAYVEAIDGDTGNAYAWIAFGGFEPGDGHLRPPEFAPRKETDWFVAATDLAVKLQVKDYVPLFERIAVPGTGTDVSFVDPDVLASAARAWIAFAPHPAANGLSKGVSDSKLPMFYRERMGGLLAEMNSAIAHEAVIAAMKSASARTQDRWAQALAGNPNGAEALLAAVESGNLSARLLQPAAVRNRLKATKPKDAEGRIAQLTKDLPPANEAIEKLIAERRNAYTAANANAADGPRVFEQNCAVCHRIDGKGGLVGPQLDGIGNRGLERLLEDILDPNRNVDRAFRTHTIILRDGDIVSGLPRREEGELLILADSTGKEISVPKKDIRERRESDTSLMPENFGEIISPENFNDLIAFLLSHGPAPTPKQ